MKRFSIFFVIALMAGVASTAIAADPALGVSDMHTYKADLSGMKMPPVATRASGEATFQLVSPGMTGGTGGVGPSSQDLGGLHESYEGVRPEDGHTTHETIPGAGVGGSAEALPQSRGTGAGTGGSVGMTGDSLKYTLTVKNISDVTAAHLHMGKTADGPVIAPLYLGPLKSGKFSGTLAQGSISDKDLQGPLAGKSIDDLAQLIATGQVFVNVHTSGHPKGEISGIVKEIS